MKLKLICIGKSSEEWLNELETQYEKKIKQIAPIQIKILKGNNLPREKAKEKTLEEAKQILQELDRNDFIIALDERGKKVDSIGFSKIISQQIEASKTVAIVIGGAFGLGEAVKDQANIKISLSDMTFNHLIARAVCLEQVYRALTIWKRIPYHN